jgi:hypothetical protein
LVNEPIRGPGEQPPSYDIRIGSGMPAAEPAPRPQRATRRHRDRIPTMAQLESLFKEGFLVLPLRYFRGYFLDMLV